MAKVMVRPTVLSQLHELMKDAAEIDIEVGYFTLSGWHMLVEPRKIPSDAEIRIIVGKVPIAFGKPAMFIKKLVGVAGIAKNPARPALTDLAYRLFGAGPYMPKLQFRLHRDDHRKVYIARKKRKLWKSSSRILIGSANLSKGGLEPHPTIYNEILCEVRRSDVGRIEDEFAFNWEKSAPVDTRDFLRVVRKYIEPRMALARGDDSSFGESGR